MSCDICGRGACANWMHSLEEQARYEKVIEAFDKARDLREEVRAEEKIESESNAGPPCVHCEGDHLSDDCTAELN